MLVHLSSNESKTPSLQLYVRDSPTAEQSQVHKTTLAQVTSAMFQHHWHLNHTWPKQAFVTLPG